MSADVMGIEFESATQASNRLWHLSQFFEGQAEIQMNLWLQGIQVQCLLKPLRGLGDRSLFFKSNSPIAQRIHIGRIERQSGGITFDCGIELASFFVRY